MSHRFEQVALVLFAGTFLNLAALAADAPATAGESPSATRPMRTNDLAPGPMDGEIAFVTARALEQYHFRQHPFNDEYSEKFFERYIESLDPQRLHFTQGDLAEFASYRTNLDNLTLARRYAADTRPAYRIFNRFIERLTQRVTYAEELLKKGEFEFNTDERIVINRRDEQPPRDLDEARKLWEQRLRSEYLGEKMGKYAAAKKAERAALNAKTNAKTNVVVATNSAVADLKPAPEAPKKTDAEDIVETLKRRYSRINHFYHELENDDVLEMYLTALSHVYDPHTDYFNTRQAENFSIGMSLSLFGIGAVLRTDDDGYCRIDQLKPGPAMNSKKIKPGDRIVAVAQSNAPPVDVVAMNINKIVQLVRGPKGTEVRLTLVSEHSTSDHREVVLIRDEINLDDQAAKGKVIDLPSPDGRTNRIGVIDLPLFYTPMDFASRGSGSKATPHYPSADVAELLAKFKKEGVKGVILDLRRNGGGSLEECVKLTGLFVKDGPIVQIKAQSGAPIVDDDPDPVLRYDGPLMVLTSRYSASASEILAGALQDYNRALIVGDLSTHGKGTVQQPFPLRMWIEPHDSKTNDPGALKITKAKFYRISGASTQLKGVMSDIVLPSKLNHAKEIGEAATENALPWDTIESARYEKLDFVQPYLPELLRISSERVGKDQEFAYVREDIEEFRRQQAENSISLNEKNRIKEWEEEDARERERNKERRSRKTVAPVIRELTLKQAELPGLPEPTTKSSDTVENAVEPDMPSEGEAAENARLEEAERILVDYIGLLDRNRLAVQGRGPALTQP